MPYLVTAETDAHVDIHSIIGLAEDVVQVHSLLFNFYKDCGGSFEDDILHYIITIYKISDQDKNYIESLYKKYDEDIEKLLENRDLEDSLWENYKCIPYISSEEEV